MNHYRRRTDHIKFFLGLAIICLIFGIAGRMELDDYERAQEIREAKIQERSLAGE